MIINRKFSNITEGTILEEVFANGTFYYEAISRPYTDEYGDTVVDAVDAVSYQNNKIYTLYPQDYRVRTR